jgi:hypothetical protein
MEVDQAIYDKIDRFGFFIKDQMRLMMHLKTSAEQALVH